MPKIKDLGINVLPEGMRPLEIGGGAGGACGCSITNPCLGCTQGFNTIQEQRAPGVCACTNATHPCRACSFEPTFVGCGCTDFTNPCFGCTKAVTITACGSGCTFLSPCLCTHNMSQPCRFGTCGLTNTPCIGGTKFPTDITDTTPVIQPGTLAAEDIVAIRQQLRSQLDALDAHEKALGDQHFDTREQQLQKELEQLQARRAELKK